MRLEVKPVGKPDAVVPHVQFDERGRETELRDGLRHQHMAKVAGNNHSPSANATAPAFDSTAALILDTQSPFCCILASKKEALAYCQVISNSYK